MMQVNLLRLLAQVSSLTLVSRVLGFVRDLLIAALFGASVATDAFVVSFRLPNLLRRLFAEGAFSQAFVPVLTQTRHNESPERTRQLIDRVFTLLFVTVFAVTIAGVIGAKWLVLLVAPGFADEPQRLVLATEMTRLTFPYILFMALVAFSSALFNTWGRFALPAATPIALNVSFIALLLLAWWLERRDPLWLAYAVLVGGVAQWGWHWWQLPRLGLLPRWSWGPADPGVRRILTLMGPAIFGVSAAQISLLLNTLFASFLPAGSLSWLYYADRLMELPAGLFGAALGVILLPFLSKAQAQGDSAAFTGLLDWGLRMTLLLTAPCALAFILIAEPITAALFVRGAFTAGDAYATAQALAAYAVGLIALIAIKILAPGCYAHQDTRTPVKGALLSLAVTQGGNLLFLLLLGWGHWALALSISLAAWANALFLLHQLLKGQHYRPQPGWRRFAGQVAGALAVMAGVILGTERFIAPFTEAGSLVRFLAIGAWVTVGAVSYFVALSLFGLQWRTLKRPTVPAGPPATQLGPSR